MSKEYSKIALSLVPEYNTDGDEIHTYWGAFHSCNRLFVMSFDPESKEIEFTGDEHDAAMFADDELCTECMEVLRDKYHAFTIALWEYKGSTELKIDNRYRGISEELTNSLFRQAYEELRRRSPFVQSVAYPNESWWRNGNLMPSLMNRTINEFYEKKNGENRENNG